MGQLPIPVQKQQKHWWITSTDSNCSKIGWAADVTSSCNVMHFVQCQVRNIVLTKGKMITGSCVLVNSLNRVSFDLHKKKVLHTVTRIQTQIVAILRSVSRGFEAA